MITNCFVFLAICGAFYFSSWGCNIVSPFIPVGYGSNTVMWKRGPLHYTSSTHKRFPPDTHTAGQINLIQLMLVVFWGPWEAGLQAWLEFNG